jgi:hypothetical protein
MSILSSSMSISFPLYFTTISNRYKKLNTSLYIKIGVFTSKKPQLLVGVFLWKRFYKRRKRYQWY